MVVMFLANKKSLLYHGDDAEEKRKVLLVQDIIAFTVSLKRFLSSN